MAQRQVDWKRLSAQQAEARAARAQPQPLPTRRVADAATRQVQRTGERAQADFWNRHPAGLPPALDAAQKDWLCDNLTVFPVYGIRLQTGGTYGDTWWADVEVAGQRFGAPFQDNGARHDFYADMRSHIAEHGTILASMRSYETGMGVGYDLCAPYDADNAVPAEEAERITGTMPPTDDVPF